MEMIKIPCPILNLHKNIISTREIEAGNFTLFSNPSSARQMLRYSHRQASRVVDG